MSQQRAYRDAQDPMRIYRGNKKTKPNATSVEKSVVNVGSMDYSLPIVVFILVLIGVVMVTSVSYLSPVNGDMFYYLKRGSLFAVMGFCIMLVTSRVNFTMFKRPVAQLSYIVANLLQLVVVFIGIASHGKQRWLPMPVIGQFQPSEVSKVALILFLAFVIAQNKNILKNWGGFLFCCGIAGITAGLALMGSLSAAIIISVTGIGIIFVACSYVARFVLAGGLGAAGVAAVILFSDSFRLARVTAWLNPFADPMVSGYQIIQSLYAIASGGMFGLGIGQSRQKSHLPEAHNDVIFAIICEELGLVGAAFVLMLFAVLIWRGVRIAANAPDTFSSLVASGIVVLVATQVLINVAVVTNSIPNTGVTLPFISYGGTSLMVMMFLMGVLLNISRCSRE